MGGPRLGPNGEISAPTIPPTKNFDPSADADALNKAMRGIGTDEDAITKIIGRRTGDEKKKICEVYKSTYGKDLIDDLKSELGGQYENLVLACMRSSSQHLAYCCYLALHGAGTDEETLAQILGCATNEEIIKIKKHYQEILKEHNCDPDKMSLEADIENDCGGKFRNVLVALVQAQRKQPTEQELANAERNGYKTLINLSLAKEQANELYNAGDGKLGTDESTFIKILVTQSVWQIAAINLEYIELTSKSLVDAIKSELGGDLGEVMLLMTEATLDRPGVYAKLIHKALAGAGTVDASLIRLISSRADIDLANIMDVYADTYGKSLPDAVRDDCSGDYLNLLLTLMNAN